MSLEAIRDSPRAPSTPDNALEGRKKTIEESQFTRLPLITESVSIDVPMQQIQKCFKEVSSKLDFKLIEVETSYATAVHRKSFTISRLLSCCFEFSANKEALTAVKLNICVEEEKATLGITVKGLYGVNHRIE